LHAKTSFLAGFVRFIRTQECLRGEMQHLGLHPHFEDFCNRVNLWCQNLKKFGTLNCWGEQIIKGLTTFLGIAC
jgi:hypothetical protein